MVKKIKKILFSILISLALIFTFTGCGELLESEEAKTFINDLVEGNKAFDESENENVSEQRISDNTTSGEASETIADPSETDKNSETIAVENTQNVVQYVFRSKKLLNQHYEKHGMEMGFANAKEYEKAASAVISNPNALHKIEKEDGDDVFYVEATNEFAVLSTDGYIRTYFKPDSGKKYFDRQ